jgi:hypothetical protein
MITTVKDPKRLIDKANGETRTGVKRRRGQPARGLDVLKKFVEEHGCENVKRRTLSDGFHLGHWVSVRRTEYKRGILSDDLLSQLEAIPGWTWDPVETRYREYLRLLREYVEEHGMHCLNARTVCDRVRLGAWVTSRRVDYREGRLARWLKRELEQIPGWTWSVNDDFHHRALELTQRYVDTFGWPEFRSRTVYEGVAIGAWVTRRRSDYHNGRLPQWLREELEKIPGWKWSLKKRREPGPAANSNAHERTDSLRQRLAVSR